jgi:hypothetical protein
MSDRSLEVASDSLVPVPEYLYWFSPCPADRSFPIFSVDVIDRKSFDISWSDLDDLIDKHESYLSKSSIDSLVKGSFIDADFAIHSVSDRGADDHLHLRSPPGVRDASRYTALHDP